MSAQPYIFSLDSFRINNTRAWHEDTDYVSVSLVVDDDPPQTQFKSMGDLNNGVYKVNLIFDDIVVDDDKMVMFSYTIVNSGHSDSSTVEKGLRTATSALA